MSHTALIICVSCCAVVGASMVLAAALWFFEDRVDTRETNSATQCPFCGARQANATMLGEADRWVCGSYQRHTGACCREDSCIAALVRSEPPDEIVSLEWDEAPRQKLLRDAESD